MENKLEQVSHGRYDFEGYILSLVPPPPLLLFYACYGVSIFFSHTLPPAQYPHHFIPKVMELARLSLEPLNQDPK